MTVCTQQRNKDDCFQRNEKQHKQKQFRIKEWDVSAALMCKQFLKTISCLKSEEKETV